MSKLWGGRFGEETDALVEALGESVSYDARLAPWDIRASLAHARMLGDCGILPKGEVKKIERGLQAVARDIETGALAWDVSLEDVHTNIEAALVARIGEAGKRLHTGRSRNDQIATDMRLWARDQVDRVGLLLHGLQEALVTLGETHFGVLLPGYTHLQNAQPVLFSHHCLAYYEMFARDRERFAQLRRRINVLPLGSAAMAGTPYPIDRGQVARELGFDAISANSMDAVSDRDYLIEFCAHAALCMAHLSRLCEELILWSSPRFAFVEIGDAFTTGSSIMPQKKNPDVAELVRGKTGRVFGDLMALLTLIKGLPLTYNRDLQEDKERLFDTADTLRSTLGVLADMLLNTRVIANRCESAASDPALLATDLADYLVKKAVPFRQAHHIVGALVAEAEKQGKPLNALPLETFRKLSLKFGADVRHVFDVRRALAARTVTGAPSPANVQRQLKRWEKILSR